MRKAATARTSAKRTAAAAGLHAHHGIDFRIEIAAPEDGHSDVVLASGRASA
jgi:hypothetical protein